MNTAITAVTVYPDRARVTRSGTISLEPGTCRLEIPELPLTLDRASVRAAARGTARARLLGLDVRQQFYAETPAEKVRQLEQQVETLADAVQALDAQAEILKQEKAALADLAGQTRVYARGLATGRTSLEVQMSLLDGFRSRAEAINKALFDLTVRQREQKRQLDRLQNELNQLRAGKARQRYVAVVEVEVLQPGDLTVELTYVVSDTGWTPLYDVRLQEADGSSRLEVGYLAQVTQGTGEDWPDVALALSTARPALAEKLPELKPWYIGPVPTPPRPAMAVMASGAPAFASKALLREAEGAVRAPPAIVEERPAEEVKAAVETSGAAITYRVPAAVSIPSDGSPHKVTVAHFELSPRLDYVTAPKLVEAVYRRAKVANDSPYTLLPGQANLFAGDEFIGATRLDLTAPQGEIELYLGADDRVKVKRELKRRDVDKRFMGNKRCLHYVYEITLENLLAAEAPLMLHDQMPVSHHESISVKLDMAEPKPTEQTELNELKWGLQLAPSQKAVVRFEFTVEHPQEMALHGMP
jgi:uncharacterized protein (TIGR02231 family)